MQLALPTGRAIDRIRHEARHRVAAAVFGLSAGIWHRFLHPGRARPPADQIAALRRWFDAAIAEDYANAEVGLYPRALAFELSISQFLRVLPEALRDLPQMVRRARQQSFELELPPQFQDDRYPDYYRRTFHWQTDGWLSAHSARIYDLQVEFLFFGAMDMMRRLSLPPLVRALRGLPSPRVLDLACGTGRFVRHLSRALPRAQVFGLDLSPHYIQKAQANCAALPGISFLCGNAEDLPLADGAFDAVSCGFLFHELPGDVRRRVLAEARRVLKPGGVLLFQDAPQSGDRNDSELSFFLDWFPSAYHEPYFKGYRADPVERFFDASGWAVQSSEPKLLSKVVVARKSSAA